MSDPTLIVQSHTGPYTVAFADDALERLDLAMPANAHVIVDARVAELYAVAMPKVLASQSVLRVEATEAAKSLDRFPAYVEHLVARKVRRDHVLIAIGGGVIQDITCFLSATLLRGIDWAFYPTTLLAQADSCIGSKSSINSGEAKNILGTFTPPREIHVSTRFLSTLDQRDVRSGIGEMLKVHAIEGPEAFREIACAYDSLFTDPATMAHFIRRSLEIKRRYIEGDEFDRGPRLVFNYGHSFGHAIEAATRFAIPHGIAVTIGMDMANWMSWRLGIGSETHWAACHPVLARNYRGFAEVPVPLEPFLAALSKDKKNMGAGSATLILPDATGKVAPGRHATDQHFAELAERFLTTVRTL